MSEPRGVNPLFWAWTMIVSLVLAAAVWMHGVWSGGLDVKEECELRGQAWDDEYRQLNLEESGRFFPLHDKCNADYDLVPFWINPAVVLLALLALFAAANLFGQPLWQRTRKPRV